MSVTLLVTPAATARLFARSLRQMTMWAVLLGIAEGFVGLVLSYHLEAAPGATIGLTAAVVFAVVFAATLPRRMPHHHRPLG
jgi:ABC-type Mn2+/Zn2+ transport system permease subunit